MNANGKYIYCVIPSEPINLQQPGIEANSPVYTINYKDVAAVVSDTSLVICDPTRKNMAGHNRVLEALMKEHIVLPARFGLVSDSEDDLRRLLAKYYVTLKDFMSKLDGRMEVGVKAFWQKDRMLGILTSRSQKLAELQTAIQAAPVSQSRALLMEAGSIIKTLADEWQVKYRDEMYVRLLKVAVDGRLAYPVDISNVLNASFLVDKATEDDFDDAIRQLDTKYGDWANIKYVKPIPAYDFVSIEMYLNESGV